MSAARERVSDRIKRRIVIVFLTRVRVVVQRRAILQQIPVLVVLPLADFRAGFVREGDDALPTPRPLKG